MIQATEQISRQYANAAINKQNWSFAYNVLAEGLVGDGVTNDTAALQALINKAIASGRRTIIFPHGQYYVTALTNDDQVDFIGDNSTFVGGYSGTIGNIGGFSELEADITQRAINIMYPPPPLVAAVGDGVTDDTVAIQAILDSTNDGDVVILPESKTFIVSDNLTITNSITIIGYSSTLKIKNGIRIRYILYANATSRITVSGITFDMNVQNTTPYVSGDYASGSYNQAIYCNGVTEKIDIQNCRFINLYNEAVFLQNNTAYLTNISNNYFSAPQMTQNLRGTHINLQTLGGYGSIIIENNVFDNAQPTSAAYGVNAIFAEGVKINTVIRKNKMNWCGRDNTGGHRLLAIDLYGNCNDFTIEDNVLDNCLWGFIRMESCQNIRFRKNKCTNHGGVVVGDPGIWVVSGGPSYTQNSRDIQIEDNEFYVYSASKIVNLISVWTLNWATNLSPQNISIKRNSVYGSTDVFIATSAGFDTLQIDDNRSFPFDGATPGYLIYTQRTQGVEPTGTESSSVTKGLRISNNRWEGTTYPVRIVLTSYTGTSEQVRISQNKLKGSAASGTTVQVANIPSYINDNFLSNSSEGVQVYGNKRAYIISNMIETMSSGVGLYIDATATDVVKTGNYYNGVVIP